MKVKQGGEELEVRYILEGSVRSSGDRLRLIVRLFDAMKSHHMWVENYERDRKEDAECN